MTFNRKKDKKRKANQAMQKFFAKNKWGSYNDMNPVFISGYTKKRDGK